MNNYAKGLKPMKKIIFLISVLAALLPFSASAEEDFTVIVDGRELICDVGGDIIGGRVFVPLRAIAEELGADVAWNGETQGITLKKDEKEVSLAIGSLSATVTQNGKSSPEVLEAAPYIKDRRTMVPLRFVSQGLDRRAAWCADLRAAVITEKNYPLEGDIKGLTESFFSELLPNALKIQGETIAAGISEAPQSVINYFSNIWTEAAIDLLAKRLTDEECARFAALAADEEGQMGFLEEMSEKYGIPLSCPVKMCALKNGGAAGILLDGQGTNSLNVSPVCVLKSVDGKVVAENL